MILDCRKVLIYLCLDISVSECFVDVKIEVYYCGDCGDMLCIVLLVGLVLGEVDSCLLLMLVVLLVEDIKLEMLCKMLVLFFEIQLVFFVLVVVLIVVLVKVLELFVLVSESVFVCNFVGLLLD